MNINSSERAGALVLFVAMLLVLGPVEAYAFGDAADQMCNHPEKFIEGKPSSYTEMNPQSPDYQKSGVIGQPCNDGTMASGYCKTIVKAGPGTGCFATKCGGTDCKQAKPGEQQPPPEQPKPEDQKGQGDGKGQGEPPKPPEMPKGGGSGGGGEKPPEQKPQQSTAENCAFSSSYGIPCEKPVSNQLGNGTPAAGSGADGLATLAGRSDSEGSAAPVSQADTSVYHRVSDSISSLWQRLSGSAPGTSDASGSATGETSGSSAASNATFGAPPTYSSSFSLEEKQTWSQQIVSWFQNLFR